MFVLGGGGGPLGAHEVGMLGALLERGIVPDVVLGTSIGAINGAAICAEPSVAGVQRLTRLWSALIAATSSPGRCCGARRRSRARAHTCTPTSRCAPS